MDLLKLEVDFSADLDVDNLCFGCPVWIPRQELTRAFLLFRNTNLKSVTEIKVKIDAQNFHSIE